MLAITFMSLKLPLQYKTPRVYGHITLHTVRVTKKSPCGFLTFLSQTLGIFNQFFTHLLHVPFYARLQIFIQLSPIFTKLCHTKRDHPSIFFYISLEHYF